MPALQGSKTWRAGRGHRTPRGERDALTRHFVGGEFLGRPECLQRIQECDQVGHFFLRQIHLETLVVKIQELGEVLRGAVVEIRGAGGKASQDGTFDAVHVAAEAGDEAFAGIGGVETYGADDGVVANGFGQPLIS